MWKERTTLWKEITTTMQREVIVAQKEMIDPKKKEKTQKDTMQDYQKQTRWGPSMSSSPFIEQQCNA